jgi:hypothetical protein
MNSVPRTIAFLIVLALPLIPVGTTNTAGGQGKGGRVPKDSTYVVVNKKGEKTREYKAGEAMPDVTDCVEIKCPKAIVRAGNGKGVRCWRCGNN